MLWFSTTWTPPDPDADHDSSPESSSDAPAVALVPDLIWRQPWVQRLYSVCQQEGDEPALQPQLTIGQVGDPYEVEADAIADKVMSMPAPQPAQIQRQGDDLDPEASEEEPTIQAKSLYTSIYQRVQRQAQGASRVGSGLESRLSHSKQGGAPLPDHVQAFMGPRLGVDLSPIRVHTDTSAIQMNQELGAQAFAHGNHVYYEAGKGPANDHLTAHELTHTVQQGAVVRATPQPERIQRQEEPGFWETVGGGLLGEFNEDPTLGQIGVDLIVGVIPIADQIADIRDIIAHLYYMISDRQYQDPMRWLGLALTLIGVIPIVGSVVKSASKVILKGADEVIGKLDELLDLLRRISPELADIGSFKRYLDQNWNSWVTEAIQTWNTILDQVGSGLRLIPNIVGDIKRQFEQSLEQIQQLSPRMLGEAFDTLKQRIDEVLDEVLRRLGGPPGGAGELVTPEGMRVRVDDPEVPGPDPMMSTGFSSRGPTPAPPERVVNALRNFSSINFRIGSETFLLDKRGMKHILERHHPQYWDGSQKAQQSFFDTSMSIDDISNAIDSVIRQNRDRIISGGTTRIYQIQGIVNGKTYILGLNRGRVGQFYPL